MVKKELALAVRRVAAGELAGEDPDADAAGVQVTGDSEHFLDGAAEAVELPDDERVTGAQVAERGSQALAPGGGLPGADFLCVDRGAAKVSPEPAMGLGWGGFRSAR
jgi:hypothetical protein